MFSKKGPSQATMSSIDPHNHLSKNKATSSMWMGLYVLMPKKFLVMPMQDRSKRISLWGSHNYGRMHIKSTVLTSLFKANPLIKPMSLLIDPPITDPWCQWRINSHEASYQHMKAKITQFFVIFNSRPNPGPITLIMSNTMATPFESPITVSSSRYQAWKKKLVIVSNRMYK